MSVDLTTAFLDDGAVSFPKAPVPTCFQSWGGRVVSIASGITSIAIRTANIAPWASAVSCLGIGFSAQSLLESFTTRKNLLAVQKAALTVLGQMPLFFLTQLWENTENPTIQTGVVDTVIALLGANAFIYIKQFYLNRPDRLEAHVVQRRDSPRFQGIFFSSKALNGIKLALSGFSLFSVFKINDYVYKMLASFGATFFISQVAGDLSCKFFDRKITANDSINGTRWRTVKNAFIFLGAIAIPACLIPWKGDAHSTTRQAQLPFIGIVLGFFQGVWNRAHTSRFRNVPVEELQEFRETGPSEESSRVWRIAHKIGQICLPTIFITGLISFFAWQIGWDLGDDQDSKNAFGSLFGGFMATYFVGTYFDHKWDPMVRHRAKDWMGVFLIAPAIMGCSVALIYSIFTNAINMADRGITRQYTWLQNTAWASYGIAMALELIKTSGKRVGTVLIPPLLVFINGALTFKRRITGQLT